MNTTPNASDPPGLDHFSRYRLAFLFSGIVFLLCGVFAMLAPSWRRWPSR